MCIFIFFTQDEIKPINANQEPKDPVVHGEIIKTDSAEDMKTLIINYETETITKYNLLKTAKGFWKNRKCSFLRGLILQKQRNLIHLRY